MVPSPSPTTVAKIASFQSKKFKNNDWIYIYIIYSIMETFLAGIEI